MPTRVPLAIRPATESDFEALTRLDLTYPTDRVLSLERSGEAPEHSVSFRWRNREAGTAVYAHPTGEWLHHALSRTDLFLVAEVAGHLAGYLMIVVPSWTDAAEITDLAVGRALRRRGAGRALVGAADQWARGRHLRSLWVEPRADNYEAIQFYLSLGFRIAGFNDRLYSNRDHEDGRPTLYMHLELS